MLKAYFSDNYLIPLVISKFQYSSASKKPNIGETIVKAKHLKVSLIIDLKLKLD